MKLRVLVESGDKRVFATALDWPGWSRGAKSREDALGTLVEYAPRYKEAAGAAAAELSPPKSIADLDVVVDTHGDKNIDYGVPHSIVDPDREPISGAELATHIKLLNAAWKQFDKVAAAAHGKTLASGAKRRRPHARADQGARRRSRTRLRRRARSERAAEQRGLGRNTGRVHRRAPRQGPWRAARKGTSRRRALARTLCHPSLGVARARPCLGDRGPHFAMNSSGTHFERNGAVKRENTTMPSMRKRFNEAADAVTKRLGSAAGA